MYLVHRFFETHRNGKMKSSDDCAACAALRSAYHAATIEHIALEGKLRVAALAHEADQVHALMPLVEGAEQRRATAREEFKLHQSAKHALTAPASAEA